MSKPPFPDGFGNWGAIVFMFSECLDGNWMFLGYDVQGAKYGDANNFRFELTNALGATIWGEWYPTFDRAMDGWEDHERGNYANVS